MQPFRFAILGAGNIAHQFVHAVSLVENACVCAVASKSKEKAEQFAARHALPAFYDDYETLIRQEKPDCVYIATTPHDHFRLSMLCLKYGVPVLCEKAMFVSGDEAEKCFETAADKNVFVMEAMWSRFLPALNKAKEWILDNRIGDIVLGQCSIGFAANPDPKGRYMDKNLGGGAAADITVYGYELLTWMLGSRPKRMHIEAVKGETQVDMTEILLMRLENNIPCTVHTSFASNYGDENKMVIFGTLGRITITNPHFASNAVLTLNDGAEETFIDAQTKNGFTYEIEEAMRCIKEKRIESPWVPHRDTLECARVFDKIYKAMDM